MLKCCDTKDKKLSSNKNCVHLKINRHFKKYIKRIFWLKNLFDDLYVQKNKKYSELKNLKIIHLGKIGGHLKV